MPDFSSDLPLLPCTKATRPILRMNLKFDNNSCNYEQLITLYDLSVKITHPGLLDNLQMVS